MRIVILFLFCLSITLSCEQRVGRNADDLLTLWGWRWEEAKTLTQKHPALKSGELEAINRPPGTWISLLKVEYAKGSRMRDECLMFRVPHEGNSGKLKSIKLKKDEQCREKVLNSSKEVIEKVDELEMKFENHELVLVVSGEKKRIDFPHFGEIPDYERFSSSFVKNDLYGSFWLRPKSIEKQEKRYGNFSDNYRDESAHVCHELKENCEEKTEYHCDQCRYGWYPVVDNVDCGETMKICGRSRCGEKGMPACPRGVEIMQRNGQNPNDQCFEGSLAGYCEETLQTVCDGDVLICL